MYLGELVNDLVDGSFVEEFKDGCLVVRSDAVSFMEAGRTALESGNLSDAVRARISEILSVLSEEDNDVLVAPVLFHKGCGFAEYTPSGGVVKMCVYGTPLEGVRR